VSHRTALWSAAALAIALTLLVGAVLLRPALGADSGDGDTQVVTLDRTRDVQTDAPQLTGSEDSGEWDEDGEHDEDEHEDEHDDDEHEDDDDDD
jgi:hypothetical protein